jgi:hypothetical protein
MNSIDGGQGALDIILQNIPIFLVLLQSEYEYMYYVKVRKGVFDIDL